MPGKDLKMGKYEPLKRYLQDIQPNINEKSLSFSEVERILRFKLPNSAYEHRAWWGNPTSPSDHPHAQSWLQAGWNVDSVDQLDKRVHFRRMRFNATGKNNLIMANMSPTLSLPKNNFTEKIDNLHANENLQFLFDLGFENIGEWLLENGSLQYKLTKYGYERNILYAFLVQGEVKYIGKSVQTLSGRMKGYKNPGPTQSTNIDKNARIKDLLSKGIKVEILVLVQKEEGLYREMPINLAAGLEDNMLSRIKPAWNKRK